MRMLAAVARPALSLLSTAGAPRGLVYGRDVLRQRTSVFLRHKARSLVISVSKVTAAAASSNSPTSSSAPPDTAMTLQAKHGAEDCIFCKIRDNIIPSYKLLETEHALAFLDAFPMTRGHVLLVPKKHFAFMEDIPEEAAAGFLKELPKLAEAVRKVTGATGVNIIQNNGAPAGQVVFHVHVHLLPRFDGDGLMQLNRSGPMIDKEVAEKLKNDLVDNLPQASL